MSVDKQGSQIIEAMTLKFLQLVMCHYAPMENLLLPYRCSARIPTENSLWGAVYGSAPEVNPNDV